MQKWKQKLCLLLALLCCLNVTACGKKDKDADTSDTSADTASDTADTAEETDAESSDTAEQNDVNLHTSVLSPEDAVALVQEKAPPGAQVLVTSAFHNGSSGNYHSYFIVTVTDSYNIQICEVAVDGMDGTLYHYAGNKQLQDFSKSPLYDPIRDVPLTWEGTFRYGGSFLCLTKSQTEEGEIIHFNFTIPGIMGTATITGNAATATITKESTGNEEADTAAEDTVIFVSTQDGILVAGSDTSLNGNYVFVSDTPIAPTATAKDSKAEQEAQAAGDAENSDSE